MRLELDSPTPIPAITILPMKLPGARGRAMHNAYTPVKPSAPVPTTLQEIQSLYSECFSSDGAQVDVSAEDDGDDDDDARDEPDIGNNASESQGYVKN